MDWSQAFMRDQQPGIEQIGDYIASPLWEDLRKFLESGYALSPRIEYSKCSLALGWNVKYRKGSRAVCTVYPYEGYFTCLVSIGGKESPGADLLLPGCTPYVRELYAACKPFNGARWLMIDVTSPEILEDTKKLLVLRIKPIK